MVRAAVVVVASTAGVFGIAAPAFADDPELSDITVDPGTIAPGQQARVRFTVTNPDPDPRQITVRVQSSDGKVVCVSTCTITNQSFDGDQSRNYEMRFGAAGNITSDLQVTFTISAKDGGSGPEVQQQLNVNAPEQAATVPEVSGVVTDTATGKGISAAKVFLQDSANASYEVGTNRDGKFTFTSRADAPIAPGTIALRVEKDGFTFNERTVQAQPGVPVRNVRLAMTNQASASASPSVAPPSGSETGEPPIAEVPNDATAGNEEEAGLSWLLIAIGGVLVLLGIGAIVLLLVRRRGEDDEDEEPGPRRGPPPGRGGPPRGAPQPPRRGAPPERTTVMRGGPGPMGPPVSPGPRGADQTMIARSPLADMPTQLHRPLPVDTDPYGARQNGAHGPQYPGGPGPAGGYGPPPYGGPPPAGYPGGGPAYGHPEPQYGQPYPGGGPAYPGGGGGYDPPAYGQPYGQGQQGAQPYDPQAGYDPYDPRGQRPPPPPAGQGGDGRRVDWLDD